MPTGPQGQRRPVDTVENTRAETLSKERLSKIARRATQGHWS